MFQILKKYSHNIGRQRLPVQKNLTGDRQSEEI